MSILRANTAKAGRKRLLAVRPSPLDKRQAHLRLGPLHFHAALGRGGITALKREGDGATPLGRLPVIGGFRRGAMRVSAPAPLALRRVGAKDGWCDAPSHAAYNRPVRLPFPASHEQLVRTDRLYDFVVILDWNIRSRRRGAGSAIFLHVARPGYLPTEGCVALEKRDLMRLLPYLDRQTALVIRRN